MNQLFHQIQHRGTAHKTHAQPVQAENLYLSYAALKNDNRVETGRWVLEDISFSINVGEQVAIIGPNGAGKSTLLKAIIGMIKPDRGRILLFGDKPEQHICIGYVPQRNQIDWRFPVTVADVVMMGRTRQIGLFRRPSKHDREVVAQSLARVGASHLADRQIGALSGGQQQRVFIARALALEASLLLLDEPLAGLDISSQETTFAILADLRADGVTALVATHDLSFAEARFDKVLLLNQRLLAFGKPTAVLTADNLLSAYGGQPMNHSPIEATN